MSLHPMFKLALTRAKDPDAVEAECKGDWDRVTVANDSILVVLKKDRRTVRKVFKLLPPLEEPVVIDVAPKRPTITGVTVYADEAGTQPVGTWRPHIIGRVSGSGTHGECLECGDKQALRGATCPALSSGKVTEAQSLVEPTVEHPLCPCGCGQPVINKNHGRQRIWASDACRKKVNGARWKADQAARAAAPVESPTTPVVEPVTPTPPPDARPVHCARCDQDGHYVEDCPQPMTRRREDKRSLLPGQDTAPTTGRMGRNPARRAEDIVCGRCKEKGHSIFTCTVKEEAKPVLVLPLSGEGVSDDDLTAHSQRLRDLCAQGLPDRFQYTYLEDVLALYGVDHDLLDSCVRGPERVEIRPESYSKEKRYCVLGFYKGDLEVIMGMRQPATPKVIAVYATSRLEHDTHRPGGSGGGGKTKTTGLPKTSKQVATRLRAMGAEVEINIVDDYTDVTYQGQDLGKIACNGDRATSEQDFQRIQRKMAAIDRRVTA